MVEGRTSLALGFNKFRVGALGLGFVSRRFTRAKKKFARLGINLLGLGET